MDLLSNIDNPAALEKLYRENKSAFKAEFNALYPELKDNKLAQYWHARLNYESTDISWGSTGELLFVVIASLLAAGLAKIPLLLHIDDEKFFQRNIGFIVLPLLSFYFIRKNGFPVTKMVIAIVSILSALVFINLLPEVDTSDTLILSCIHLPVFLWAVLGFTYAGNEVMSHRKRLDFLRYNGDLLIMTTLILIAGAILTAITIGLFSVIGFKITEFYFKYIAIAGLAAAPIVGTYITQTNPQLVNKVSPVIARIFSPLVLIMLVIYLGAIFYSGKNPYSDRDFLMVFNFLLLGVMAIILFSVAESSKKNDDSVNRIILLALSVVTMIVNAIALSAILFRISEGGITPNRLAVSGGNILILINLAMVTYRLFKSVMKKAGISEVENSISMFLPVYILWTVVVSFIFPLVFQFK